MMQFALDKPTETKRKKSMEEVKLPSLENLQANDADTCQFCPNRKCEKLLSYDITSEDGKIINSALAKSSVTSSKKIKSTKGGGKSKPKPVAPVAKYLVRSCRICGYQQRIQDLSNHSIEN